MKDFKIHFVFLMDLFYFTTFSLQSPFLKVNPVYLFIKLEVNNYNAFMIQRQRQRLCVIFKEMKQNLLHQVKINSN